MRLKAGDMEGMARGVWKPFKRASDALPSPSTTADHAGQDHMWLH